MNLAKIDALRIAKGLQMKGSPSLLSENMDSTASCNSFFVHVSFILVLKIVPSAKYAFPRQIPDGARRVVSEPGNPCPNSRRKR